MSCFWKTIDSPVGRLTLIADEAALLAVLWENDPPTRVPLGERVEAPGHPVLQEAERQLAEYFGGQRQAFTLKLHPRGTPFQTRVWQALLTIPHGETRSYAQIARAIGKPNAVRAVGTAIGRNPLSILTPCHRVVGSNGKLTGFAGGLGAKAFLLELEGAPYLRP